MKYIHVEEMYSNVIGKKSGTILPDACFLLIVLLAQI